MFIDLTPEQRQLQAELRQYFSTLVTPDEAALSLTGAGEAFIAQPGEAWVGVPAS